MRPLSAPPSPPSRAFDRRKPHTRTRARRSRTAETPGLWLSGIAEWRPLTFPSWMSIQPSMKGERRRSDRVRRPPRKLPRRRVPALPGHGHETVDGDLRRQRIELGRATGLGHRFVEPAHESEHEAELIVSERIVRIERECPAKFGFGSRPIMFIPGLVHGQRGMSLGGRVVELDRLLRRGLRALGPASRGGEDSFVEAGPEVCVRETGERGRKARIPPDWPLRSARSPCSSSRRSGG